MPTSSSQNDFFMESVQQVKQQLDQSTGSTPTDSLPQSPELSYDSSRGSISSIATPSSLTRPVADSFVFAFDIDGVLVRGGKPIPEAIKAMQVLNGDNAWGLHV